MFSSLEGISFDWSLISDTDVDQESIVDAHNIIRYVVRVVLVLWDVYLLQDSISFCDRRIRRHYTFRCRILKYSESHYETPHHIETLEREGKQGYTILVEGIRTGSAKVTAKLSDPVYKVSGYERFIFYHIMQEYAHKMLDKKARWLLLI